MKTFVLTFGATCTALWALAWASLLNGNESAINAVIGIPIGAALWFIGGLTLVRLSRTGLE